MNYGTRITTTRMSTYTKENHTDPPRLVGSLAGAGIFSASKGLFYKWISLGLCTPGVKIGTRAVRWPEHELHRIAEARISGATEQQVRALVNELMAARGMDGRSGRADQANPPQLPPSRSRVPAVTRRSAGV